MVSGLTSNFRLRSVGRGNGCSSAASQCSLGWLEPDLLPAELALQYRELVP